MSLLRSASKDEKKSDDDNLRLLKELKKEVKQIMEEAVTRKFINEESNSVTSLCSAIDAVLLFGLKKRVLGLFGPASTFGLLHKISAMCPPAATIVKKVLDIQQAQFKSNRFQRSTSDADSVKSRYANGSHQVSSINMRYLWIRLALFDKVLSSIVEYIFRNGSRYYEKGALMLDPVMGSMVATLIGKS